MRRWEAAETEERAGHGDVGFVDEIDEGLRGAGLDDAVARKENRTLCLSDQPDGFLELLGERRIVGPVAREHNLFLTPLEHLVMSTTTGPGRPERAM